MKALLAILALMVASQSVALAQVEDESVRTVADELAVDADNSEIVAAPTPAKTSPQSQPIVILNNQRVQSYQGANQESQQGAVQVQEQPVTVVQDSPLSPSPAEVMRKRRQATEAATEDGIVQALERARIEDEMKRRDKFNNAIAPVVTEPTPAPTYVQPVQEVVVAPVVEPVKPSKERYKVASEDYGDDDDLKDERIGAVDIRSEVRAALEEVKPHKEEKNEYYVSGFASFGNYDQVININSSMGYGFSVGTMLPDRLIAEGSFTYGNYEIEKLYYNSWGGYQTSPFPMIVDMRQYSVSAALKYSILPGRFRPLAGAILSYTRRVYSFESYDFRTSDAVDVGAMAGADLQVSDNFAIGIDFRYMTNLGYKQNLRPRESFVLSQSKHDPERLNYYMLNLIGRFTF